jgi:quercetin dioxygenase-like cupin family protein
MEAFLLDKILTFSRESHTKNVFFEFDRLKAQVMGLEPGQEIPPCRMDHDVIFVVMEGNGKIIVDGEEEAIKKSSFVFVPKEKETRSLKALTKMAVLAIQVKF